MNAALWCATGEGLLTLDGERRAELEDHDVRAVDDGPAGMWAIVDDHELWHLDGDDWREVATSDHGLRCVLSSASGVFAGTANAHLLRLADEELQMVDAFEQVDGREDWFTPWGGPPDVRSLAETGSRHLLVNVHVGGIPRSTDGGETWAPTIEIDADVHQVIAAGDMSLAATTRGLAVSEDAGETWTFDDAGLHATYARAVTVAGDHLLMSVSDGPWGGHAAMYRRAIRGNGSFQKCEEGLPTWFDDNIDTGCLVAAGSTVAFATGKGALFTSSDSGETWTEEATDLPPVHWLEFA